MDGDLRQVACQFFSRWHDVWVLNFFDPAQHWVNIRCLTLHSKVSFREMLARAAPLPARDQEKLELALHEGRGMVMLKLTEAQYARLRR